MGVRGEVSLLISTFLTRLSSPRPQLDKARRAYHKVSRKEQAARERDLHAQGNPDVSIDKQKKIQEERALVQQEAEKVEDEPRAAPWWPEVTRLLTLGRFAAATRRSWRR